MKSKWRIVGSAALLLALAVGCGPPAQVSTPPEVPTQVKTRTPEAVVGLAVAELAQRLGVDTRRITVLGVEAVQWPDASLGLPEPGKVYAQVITPGYRIQLEVDGKVYELHGDTQGHFVMARDPEPVIRPAPQSRLHALVDYFMANHPDWGLDWGMEWVLEDVTAPGLGGSQAWVWRSGPWSVELSAASTKSTSYQVVLTHEHDGVAWHGALQADGQVTPKDEPVPSNPEDAFRYLLNYFDQTYPGFGLSQQLQWLHTNVTPPGSEGSSTRLWNAGEWSLVMSFSVVPQPDYAVLLKHSSAGTVWSGVLRSDGQVVSEQPLLLSVAVEPCDETMSPEELQQWAGVALQVKDGLVYITHRLSYVCCAELALAAGRDGSVIKIVETNVGEACLCMCGYTLQAELNGLPSGDYTVEVWGVQHVPAHSLELLGRGQVTVKH